MLLPMTWEMLIILIISKSVSTLIFMDIAMSNISFPAESTVRQELLHCGPLLRIRNRQVVAQAKILSGVLQGILLHAILRLSRLQL